MNKNIKLAVAGAVLALSASANAGIIIPAGDWTLDIGGNVNAYSVWTKNDTNGATVNGGLTALSNGGTSNRTQNNMTTGLLPNFLSVSGSTRQNDLDVAFTISLQPGTSNTGPLQGATGGYCSSCTNQNNRQAFLTFGDKSWGTIKLGKDLGVFASDAILSDMTLLGVGASTGAGGNTTLGRIGAGYIYADWKPQISYTTPNFNGFQATAALTQAWNQTEGASGSLVTTNRGGAATAYEGKASYSFAANDVTGKIWVSGLAQKMDAGGQTHTSPSGKVSYNDGITLDDTTVYAGDIGANVNVAGFGLTGYYYNGSGIGTTGQMLSGYAISALPSGKDSKKSLNRTATQRDSDGGYVQATYVLPTKTKVGVSWGISNLDLADGETNGELVKENEMWVVGAYHPLTKHLNLVAEYSYLRSENQAGGENKAYSGSLGAILFF